MGTYWQQGLLMMRFGYGTLQVAHRCISVKDIPVGSDRLPSIQKGASSPAVVRIRLCAYGKSVVVNASRFCKDIPVGYGPLLSVLTGASLPVVVMTGPYACGM